MSGKFENKTVFVTGAGKNIGKSIAAAFAMEGANIVVCDWNPEAAAQTTAEIKAMGANALTVVCDVRNRDSVESCVKKAVDEFGGIDILVNNAGGSAALLGKLTDFKDAEPDTIDFVIDVNLKGSVNCIKAVLNRMVERKCGKIINMSSIAAVVGLRQRADYAAAKAGLIGMTRTLAIELGKYNICVNCVSPGAIERDGCKQSHMTFLGEDGHSGTPQDIADTVLFLAGQDYITGQNIIVDGGRTLGPNAL